MYFINGVYWVTVAVVMYIQHVVLLALLQS